MFDLKDVKRTVTATIVCFAMIAGMLLIPVNVSTPFQICKFSPAEKCCF